MGCLFSFGWWMLLVSESSQLQWHTLNILNTWLYVRLTPKIVTRNLFEGSIFLPSFSLLPSFPSPSLSPFLFSFPRREVAPQVQLRDLGKRC